MLKWCYCHITKCRKQTKPLLFSHEAQLHFRTFRGLHLFAFQLSALSLTSALFPLCCLYGESYLDSRRDKYQPDAPKHKKKGNRGRVLAEYRLSPCSHVLFVRRGGGGISRFTCCCHVASLLHRLLLTCPYTQSQRTACNIQSGCFVSEGFCCFEQEAGKQITTAESAIQSSLPWLCFALLFVSGSPLSFSLCCSPS